MTYPGTTLAEAALEFIISFLLGDVKLLIIEQ
jgi:hypothetical protein